MEPRADLGTNSGKLAGSGSSARRPSERLRVSGSNRTVGDSEKQSSSLTSKLARAAEIKQKKAERLLLWGSVSFILILLSVVWLTNGAPIEKTIQLMNYLEDPTGEITTPFGSVNCRHPRNINTAFCQERLAETEGRWRSMSRVQDGKVNPFPLYMKNKKR